MALVHELGHGLSVIANGGIVHAVVWRYGLLSETVRSGSAWPNMDTWAGPLMGCAVPVLLWLCLMKFNVGRYFQWFASICCLGNGLYLGLGWIDVGTDANDLVVGDVSLIPIIGAGLVTFMAGMFLLLWEKTTTHPLLNENRPPSA